MEIIQSTVAPTDPKKITELLETPEDFFIPSESEPEIRRKRIKHKKAKKKVALPKLTDTSRGAFEKFKEEQEMKKEKKVKDEIDEREKLKKYFMELKALKQLNDEQFDNYIKGKFETLKNIKESNDIKLRKESFIYHIFKDIELYKKRKQKFNFVSPVNFKNQ